MLRDRHLRSRSVSHGIDIDIRANKKKRGTQNLLTQRDLK